MGIDGLYNLGFGFTEIGDVSLDKEEHDQRLGQDASAEKVLEGSNNLMWRNLYMNDKLELEY